MFEQWWDVYNIKITLGSLQQMTTTNHKFTIFLQNVHQHQDKKAATQKVRPPHLIKWKIIMLQALQKLTLHSHYDGVLLDRLTTLIRKLPEEHFIQAIMNMQPLRPQITTLSYPKPESSISAPLNTKIKQVLPKVNFQQTSTTDTILKSIEEKQTARRNIEQQQLLTHLINSQIMTQQLSYPNHPFTKIIEGVAILLQNKYKVWIANVEEKKGAVKMQKLCKALRQDMKMVEQFFQMASQPIVDTLSVNGMRDKNIERSFASFIISFLRNNKKIFEVLRKILRYAVKRSQEQALFEVHCPQEASIDNFEVPPSLQIQGCYLYTIHKIVEFINSSSPQQSLKRLAEIRDSFYQDISQYLKANGSQCQKVNGQSQLEIFKYLVTKLRIFSGDLFAGLKLLEVIYGQEQMGYCYDISSYIHSQLSIALEAIREHL